MRAWLYTIMVRLACDYHRRQKGRGRNAIDPEELPSAPIEEQEVWVEVSEGDLARAVAGLGTAFRQVFELHEVHRPEGGWRRRP